MSQHSHVHVVQHCQLHGRLQLSLQYRIATHTSRQRQAVAVDHCCMQWSCTYQDLSACCWKGLRHRLNALQNNSPRCRIQFAHLCCGLFGKLLLGGSKVLIFSLLLAPFRMLSWFVGVSEAALPSWLDCSGLACSLH